jgi:hypothetical protein
MKPTVKTVFAREAIVSITVSAGRLRRACANFSSIRNWRFLWLTEGVFLSVGWKEYSYETNEIDPRDISEFIVGADGELSRMLDVVSEITGTASSFSVLPKRCAWIIDEHGFAQRVQRENDIAMNGPWGTVQVSDVAATVLASRPLGARLYSDAIRSNNLGRKFTDCFRVLEAGFGVKGGKLSRKLIPFLKTGKFPIDLNRWQSLKMSRDWLNHAYRNGETSFDADVMDAVRDMEVIAADVLLHKKIGGKTTLKGCRRTTFATTVGQTVRCT